VQSRRAFLTGLPLGLAGLAAACRANGNEAASPAAASTPAGPPARSASAGSVALPAPLLREVPATAPPLKWTPEHRHLDYTFGGAAPRHRIAPGTHIVPWAEDCFDGLVKTADDMPSKVMPAGHDNPQTGPFYIEGAEPGDTIAVHLLKLEPARSYAVSSFGPGFGALGGTDRTAMLAPDFPD